jgi:hypothetical protein
MDRSLKCNKLHWGFKTGEDRAEHCMDRARQANVRGRNGAANFWHEEALKALDGRH